MDETIRITGIYCIKNLITNKVYIGQSVDVYHRIHAHALLAYSDKKVSHLYNSIRKHGEDNFEVSILEETEDRSKLNELEYKWINTFDACNREKGYNTRLENGTTYEHSDETKQKISESLKNVPKSEEHKANMLTSYKKGYTMKEETLKKRSAAIKLAWEEGRHAGNTLATSTSFKKGQIPHNKGISSSNETKEKQRIAKLGTHQSKEHIAAVIAARGYNRIYQFTLDYILVNIYDTIIDVVKDSEGKYLQPGVHKSCNGGSLYYKDSVFKYEKDIILIETEKGTSFTYKDGTIPPNIVLKKIVSFKTRIKPILYLENLKKDIV